jgi:hypothetical protein
MKRFTIISVLVILSVAVSFGQTRLGGGAKLGGQTRVSNSPLPGGILDITGNSLPSGFSMDGAEYGNIAAVLGRRFDAAYGPGRVFWFNDAVAGRTLEQMIVDSNPTDFQIIAPHHDAGKHNVLVTWEVVNSRLLTTPRDTVAHAIDLMKTYGGMGMAAGWYTVPITMSASAFDTVPDADFQAWELTDRFTVDGAMRADANTHWNALADLAADPIVAANVQVHDAQSTHPENFVGGGIHMAKFGSPFVCDAVFPLLTSPFGFPAPTSLAAKLKAVFPLWNTVPPGGSFTAWDFWGNNHANLAANSVQNTDYVTFPSSGGGGGAGAQINAFHTLHARSTGFSFSGWFRPIQIERGNEQRIGSVADWNQTDQNEWLVYVPAGDTHVVFKTSDDGTTANSHTATSTVSLSNNNWYFITAAYDGTNISISVNNETPVTTVVSTIKTNSMSTFRLGSDNASSMWIGDVKWVIFCYSPLSGTERIYLYNGGAARSTLFGQ